MAKKQSSSKGLLNFVREQGIIGLAVGLAIGSAAGATVKQFVDNLVNPIVGFILGGTNLSSLMWNTGLRNGNVELSFGWGAILSSIITLLATALVIYYVVHVAKLDKLDKKKE
jgi:large conductance mechanosensitive channel